MKELPKELPIKSYYSCFNEIEAIDYKNKDDIKNIIEFISERTTPRTELCVWEYRHDTLIIYLSGEEGPSMIITPNDSVVFIPYFHITTVLPTNVLNALYKRIDD